MIDMNITEPPRLGVNKFARYRRDLLWWMDIHSDIGYAILLRPMAIQRHDEKPNPILPQFLESDRDDIIKRPFGRCLKALGGHFAKTSADIALGKTTIWEDCVEKSFGGLRNYWIRYAKMLASLGRSVVEMPSGGLFNKAIAPMSLKIPILGIPPISIEAQEIARGLFEIKRIPFKPTDAQFVQASGEILKVEGAEYP